MIIAKTRLRKIPDKCLNCKFCIDTKKLNKKCYREFWDCYRLHRCFITSVEVPFEFNPAKEKFEFTKCKSCPLEEVEIVI